MKGGAFFLNRTSNRALFFFIVFNISYSLWQVYAFILPHNNEKKNIRTVLESITKSLNNIYVNLAKYIVLIKKLTYNIKKKMYIIYRYTAYRIE